MSETTALSVIIPLFNEEAQFALTLAGVVPVLEEAEPSYELLFVDDGSRDTTWELVRRAAAENPKIRGLRLSRNFGKEAALCAGLEHARGEAILLMDGDLQHPPRYIPEFLAKWREGWQIVDGIKTDRGRESFLHRFFVGRFYRLFHKATGVDLAHASDFKLLDREVVEAWKKLRERTTFFRGMVAWLGFRHTTVPFVVEERGAGQTKWSMRGLFRLALDAIVSFSSKPLHLTAWLGVICLLLFLVVGVQTIVRFAMGEALEGFTTVILLQLLIGGAILLSLALIGLYISKIYEEIKGRPRYLIGEDTAK